MIKKIKCFLLTSVALGFLQLESLAMERENEPQNIIHTRKEDIPSFSTSALDALHQECLQKRGIAIKTSKTVISPLLDTDLPDYYKIYDENSKSNGKEFIEVADKSTRNAYRVQKIVYSNSLIEDRKKCIFTEYAIYAISAAGKGELAGFYEIKNLNRIDSNDLGWSNAVILLKPQYRGKGIASEVIRAITSEIVQPHINKKPLLYRYIKCNPSDKNAITIEDPSPVLEGTYKLETFLSPVSFKGLQAEIQPENTPSLQTHEKSGWKKIREQEKGGKNFFIFRYGNSTS